MLNAFVTVYCDVSPLTWSSVLCLHWRTGVLYLFVERTLFYCHMPPPCFCSVFCWWADPSFVFSCCATTRLSSVLDENAPVLNTCLSHCGLCIVNVPKSELGTPFLSERAGCALPSQTRVTLSPFAHSLSFSRRIMAGRVGVLCVLVVCLAIALLKNLYVNQSATFWPGVQNCWERNNLY